MATNDSTSVLYPPILETYNPAFVISNIAQDEDHMPEDIKIQYNTTEAIEKRKKSPMDFSRKYYFYNGEEQKSIDFTLDTIVNMQERWVGAPGAFYIKNDEDDYESITKFPATGEVYYSNSIDSNKILLSTYDVSTWYSYTEIWDETKDPQEITSRAGGLYIDTAICKASYALSPYNDQNGTGVEYVQISLKDQKTNQSALNPNRYPQGIMWQKFQKDENNKPYITITPDDMKDNKFYNNKYYKLQIRLVKSADNDVYLDFPQDMPIMTSDGTNNYSEWSSIMLLRGISQPNLNILNTAVEGGKTKLKWSLAKSKIDGSVSFEDEGESETLRSYSVKLYSNSDTDPELYEDSGTIYTSDNINPNVISYNLKCAIDGSLTYKVVISITTKNLYTESKTYILQVSSFKNRSIPIILQGRVDPDNGRVMIHVQGSYSESEKLTGTFTIRRSSDKSSFQIWENMNVRHFENATDVNYVWSDFTVESGVFYQYAIQYIDDDDNRGCQVQFQEPVMLLFDDIFLADQDRQLTIKFNPTISNYKKQYSESKTETLGSQFPFIRRNGNVQYTQFSISGMIASAMDEHGLFYTRKEAYGDYSQKYIDFNSKNNVNPEADYIYEKKFRDEVIDFLYNGNAKLFRSATEGNHIIKLMDISLTPEKALGRMLYTFNATAYEIASPTIDNYENIGILQERS